MVVFIAPALVVFAVLLIEHIKRNNSELLPLFFLSVCHVVSCHGWYNTLLLNLCSWYQTDFYFTGSEIE